MLCDAYLQATGRLEEMMRAIQEGGVPKKFTHEFLKSIGFKSTNDRTFISLLKGIGFLNDNGEPTEYYKAYKNKTEAKKLLGRILRNRYEDLFTSFESAHEQSNEKIKGVFATKTGKGNAAVKLMALTFLSLAKLADFNDSQSVPEQIKEKEVIEHPKPTKKEGPAFHYNIQIHLPVTKDISVYNAIFKSIKEHLS